MVLPDHCFRYGRAVVLAGNRAFWLSRQERSVAGEEFFYEVSKMKAVLVLVLLLIIGCSTVFTTKKQLEPGVYLVSAAGNAFNTREDLLGKIKQRAANLCGHENYTLKTVAEYQSVDGTSYVAGQHISTSHTAMDMVVDCNGS